MSVDPIQVELLTVKDINSYIQHLQRHFSESINDSLIFHPYEVLPDFNTSSNKEKLKKTWQASTASALWERVWAVKVKDQIIAHLDIHSHHLSMVKHRAIMGMGIEQDYRGQKIGMQLIIRAIDWALEEKRLDWLDLNVFSHNLKALKLYQQNGFQKTGEQKDLFRVKGQKINDISMTFDINSARSCWPK